MATIVDIELDPAALIAAHGPAVRAPPRGVLAQLSTADKARGLAAMAQAIRDAEADYPRRERDRHGAMPPPPGCRARCSTG